MKKILYFFLVVVVCLACYTITTPTHQFKFEHCWCTADTLNQTDSTFTFICKVTGDTITQKKLINNASK